MGFPSPTLYNNWVWDQSNETHPPLLPPTTHTGVPCAQQVPRVKELTPNTLQIHLGAEAGAHIQAEGLVWG